MEVSWSLSSWKFTEFLGCIDSCLSLTLGLSSHYFFKCSLCFIFFLSSFWDSHCILVCFLTMMDPLCCTHFSSLFCSPNSVTSIIPYSVHWLFLLPVSIRVVLCFITQSCLTLCDAMDCSLPASFVHGEFPGKNTGVDCNALLQEIFPTQGSNPGLP